MTRMTRIVSALAHAPRRLAAAVAAYAMTSGRAWASDDDSTASTGTSGIGGVADTVTGNFSSLGKALVGGAFLGGFGLAGSGLMKLKQAADSGGQQVKYSEGLWRLAVGAGLASLPVVTGTASGTLFSNSSGNTVTEGTITIN